MAKKVVVIGAGIGGLATASMLARAGYEVHVYEKEKTAGGRAGQLKVRGFTFDTGPSWYLMPDVFDHYFDIVGESTKNWLTLKKLTPAYKVFFESTAPVVISGNLKKDALTFESIEQGAGAALESYVAKSNEIYRLSLQHFLYSNFERASDFLKKDVLKKVGLLPRLLTEPIDKYVRRFVSDVRLRQILEYPMVFLGTSPFTAPSMYSLMSALDFKEGVFFPQGGMYEIIKSLQAVGKKNGVQFHFGQKAEEIIADGGRVAGVRINAKLVKADIVISNADLYFTETQLLPKHLQTYPEAYWQNREAGPSALLLYLGVKKRIPEFEHHNLLLVDDWKENFEAIYDSKTIPKKASLYISKTSHSDESVAPNDMENIFVLVPLPAGISLSNSRVEKLTNHYLDQIERMTRVNLKDHLVVKETFGPDDFKTQYFSWQSSMLGQSHLLKQSAFFRTPNKSKKLKNLYYVGGSTTPGIGLPMCLIGAELVYKRITGDKRGGPISPIEKVA